MLVNHKAEQQVIGRCLLSEDCLTEARAVLSPGDFFDEFIAEAFSACCQHQDANLGFWDLAAIKQRCPSYKENASRLVEWMEGIGTTVGTKFYAEQVRAHSIRRKLSARVEALASDLETNGSTVHAILFEALEGMLRDAGIERSDGAADLRDIIPDVLSRASTPAGAGVPSGIEALDDLLSGGWKSGQYVIVAARPSMGKTAMLLQLAFHAAARNIPTLFFSLEMDRLEVGARLLCPSAGVGVSDALAGHVSPDELRKMSDSGAMMDDTPFRVVDDASLRMSEIAAITRTAKLRTGLGLVVIDYLGLVTPPKAENRNQELSKISRSVKLLAKSARVPVLCAHQLNRETTGRNDPRPRLSDLRDSGALEQDADIVIGIHRDDYYRIADSSYIPTNQTELIVLKHRNGPTGVVKTRWQPSTMRFGGM